MEWLTGNLGAVKTESVVSLRQHAPDFSLGESACIIARFGADGKHTIKLFTGAKAEVNDKYIEWSAQVSRDGAQS